MEGRILPVDIGTELDQQSGEFEVSLVRGQVQRRGAAVAVDAEPHRDQQPDCLRPTQLHRLGHGQGSALPGLGQQPGIGVADRVRVPGQSRGQQLVDGVQAGGSRS